MASSRRAEKQNLPEIVMPRWVLAAAALLFAADIAHAADATSDDVKQRLTESRAVEAVIWGMPAVNTELMRQQMLKAGGKANEIIYWGKPLDWHNQTLTPNPDTLYFMGFFDTKAAGPMVVKIPRAGDDGSLNGNIVTVWQSSLEDVGLLGVDKGTASRSSFCRPAIRAKFRRDTSH
jgi:hypothetical protein